MVSSLVEAFSWEDQMSLLRNLRETTSPFGHFDHRLIRFAGIKLPIPLSGHLHRKDQEGKRKADIICTDLGTGLVEPIGQITNRLGTDGKRLVKALNS